MEILLHLSLPSLLRGLQERLNTYKNESRKMVRVLISHSSDLTLLPQTKGLFRSRRKGRQKALDLDYEGDLEDLLESQQVLAGGLRGILAHKILFGSVFYFKRGRRKSPEKQLVPRVKVFEGEAELCDPLPYTMCFLCRKRQLDKNTITGTPL